MLQCRPQDRATADELLSDPWLNQDEDDDDIVLYKDVYVPESEEEA